MKESMIFTKGFDEAVSRVHENDYLETQKRLEKLSENTIKELGIKIDKTNKKI